MKNSEAADSFFIHTLWNFETCLMVFFGVFDFSRCFQVRIDVTVEAKQLQAHGGDGYAKLRKNGRKKPFESNGWLLIIMSPNGAFP